MANVLFKAGMGRRYLAMALSKDWYTCKPWTHKGDEISYFDICKNTSESGNVKFTYIYMGPIALVIGTWIQ